MFDKPELVEKVGIDEVNKMVGILSDANEEGKNHSNHDPPGYDAGVHPLPKKDGHAYVVFPSPGHLCIRAQQASLAA